MADQRIKQIKIKTAVVKSATKGKFAYEMEVITQSAKVEKMKNENKDEHDIRKQIDILEESRVMIPDARRRLKSSIDELASVLAKERDFAESKEYKEAEEVLEAARAALD